MRKRLAIANWKMNKTRGKAAEFVKKLKRGVKTRNVEVVVCPTFTALSTVARLLKGTFIKLGAQNMHYEKNGAFTGEVSARMLKELGCTYVILGHSERRKYFNEADSFINKKVRAALDGGLGPILCVGENLTQRRKGLTKSIVRKQLIAGLKGVSKKELAKVVIAYEPIWAIGTGKTAKPEQAEEVHAYIRKLLETMFGKKISQNVRITYGGSVNPKNIKELISMPDIDGSLIGGASLNSRIFGQLVKLSS